MTDTAGVTLLGHGGNTQGFSSLLQFNLESKTGFAMMTNKQLDRVYKGGSPEVLYGKLDFATLTEENFTKLDLSGHYKMTGGMFDKGCFKVYGLLEDDFSISGSDDSYTGSRGGVVSVEQISDTAVRVKLVTGSEYIYYLRSKDGKVIALENGSLDFIKVSTIGYYLDWFVLGLMLAGMALMILFTLIHAIRLRKYKEKEEYKFKRTELLTGICVIALAVCIFLLSQLGLISMSIRSVLCIAISLFAVALTAGNILCIRYKPANVNTVVTVIESICSLFIITGVIYWELWRFWRF